MQNVKFSIVFRHAIGEFRVVGRNVALTTFYVTVQCTITIEICALHNYASNVTFTPWQYSI